MIYIYVSRNCIPLQQTAWEQKKIFTTSSQQCATSSHKFFLHRDLSKNAGKCTAKILKSICLEQNMLRKFFSVGLYCIEVAFSLCVRKAWWIIPCLNFFFFKWRSARRHLFYSLGQNQSTVAQQAKMTAGKFTIWSTMEVPKKKKVLWFWIK